jgi:Cof subfamily protein (haloacid dehalogenase superfamily)
MDGTLLDENGVLPDHFWPILARMQERGITFVAASGRQYPALTRLFGGRTEGISFIAENGTYVVQDDVEVSASPLSPAFARRFLASVRGQAAAGQNVGAVWCGRSSAYVERTDAAFLAEVTRYYARLQPVERFEDVGEDALKFAVWVAGDPESAELADLRRSCAPCQPVVSSDHWIDVMPPDVSKGTALRDLQRELGVTAEETMVFGDYLNDLEMLDEAAHSFAMANAHPEVRRRARYVAPANSEYGVLQVVSRLIGEAA